MFSLKFFKNKDFKIAADKYMNRDADKTVYDSALRLTQYHFKWIAYYLKRYKKNEFFLLFLCLKKDKANFTPICMMSLCPLPFSLFFSIYNKIVFIIVFRLSYHLVNKLGTYIFCIFFLGLLSDHKQYQGRSKMKKKNLITITSEGVFWLIWWV